MGWREAAQASADRKLTKARDLIARCQASLKRELSDGERRDLLRDNTEWEVELVAAIVAELRGTK